VTVDAESTSLPDDLEKVRQTGTKGENTLDLDATSSRKVEPRRVLLARLGTEQSPDFLDLIVKEPAQ
jgi:hypothetical protein